MKPFYLLLSVLSLFVAACSGSKNSTVSSGVSSTAAVARTQEPVVQIGTQFFDNPFLYHEFILSGEADSTSLPKYTDFVRRYTALRLKVKEAERIGLDQDSTLIADLSNYRSQLGTPYLLENAVYKPLIAEAYAREKENVQVSHILIAVEVSATPEDTLRAYQKAVAVRDSALQGIDFNQLAIRNSSDPSSARNQGRLPLVSRGKYIYPFENIAYQTPVGQVSKIVRSKEFGYHFLKVEARKPASLAKQFSQIYIQPKGTAKQDTLDAKARMQEVIDQLKAGKAFDELARQVNDDDFLKERGGDIGMRKRGDLIEPLDSAAFALEKEGDLSEPLQSSYGFHLFKLTKLETSKSIEQQSSELRSQLQANPYLQDFVKAFKAKLLKSMPVAFDEGAFFAKIDQVNADSLFEELAPGSKTLRPKFGEEVVANLNGLNINFTDFADFSYRRPKEVYENPRQAARRLMGELLVDRAIDAQTLTLDRQDANFANLVQKYRDGTLMFKISQDSIWTPATKDSVGLRAYFNANAAKYRFGERTKAVSFFSVSDSLIQVVYNRLNAGERYEDVASSFKANRNVRFETVYLTEPTNSVYDKALTLTPNQPSAPEPYQRGKVILLNAGKEAPRNKTYEESLSELTGDYQQVVEEKWIQRLYQRYNVRIFENRIALPKR